METVKRNPMRITLALRLPQDAASIPACRHILRHLLRDIGVARTCIDDITLAQTEACTNVVEHAGPGEEYEVRVEVDARNCVIRVSDAGQGFDWRRVGPVPYEVTAEGGRGIDLMRALADNVRFLSEPNAGTVVVLEKTLEFAPDAFIHWPVRPSRPPDPRSGPR